MEITKDVILRAWREEEYRNSLPEETRKQIPARPTGDNG
jgi:mersacidin/lichenicidin family type 2 lantibiotic